MIDTIQLVLLLVIVVLSVFLLVLGVQVFFILKDFRKTLRKFNRVLDNTESITSNIARPLDSVSSLASGFRSGGAVMTALKIVRSLLGDEEESKKSA